MQAVQIADALLRLPTVVAVTGLSRTSIYRSMSAGTFPPAIKLGARCSRWRAGDVTQWLRSKAETAPSA
ncbi:AlpA family transcriptional regulator [Variovorax sp. SG517]|uniref:helix-turn-helix transcriptional regulator n=1 Tax=Variovorax sp. SG517 TaxID=2587117 RepID=UPI00159D2E25|nr:AlpA family phage regulatory protein [Variovorax sp. SG517]